MNKTIALFLILVLLSGAFAGCTSDAEPGDKTQDGFVDDSGDDYKDNDNQIKDYDAQDGIPDENDMPDRSDENSAGTGNSADDKQSDTQMEPRGQNRSGAGS